MTSNSPVFQNSPHVIHEYRTYVIEPSMLAEYLKLVESCLQPIRQDRYGILLGFWYSVSGALHQVHHLWEYESLDQRQQLRTLLSQQLSWREDFLEKAVPAILTQEIRFLRPVVTVTAPSNVSAFYEMRRYQAVTGKAAQLLQEVRSRQCASGSTLIGLWTCESPDPNDVLELLSYTSPVPGLGSVCDEPDRIVWLDNVKGMVRGGVATMLLPTAISPLR